MHIVNKFPGRRGVFLKFVVVSNVRRCLTLSLRNMAPNMQWQLHMVAMLSVVSTGHDAQRCGYISVRM